MKAKEIKNNCGLSLLIECEKCGTAFDVQSGAGGENNCICHKKKYTFNELSGSTQLFLTYYDCRSCGNRHFVQIDDNDTLRLLKDNRELFKKIAAQKASGKSFTWSQKKKYKNQSGKLRNKRFELMKAYEGATVYDDETGKSFVLRFSV